MAKYCVRVSAPAMMTSSIWVEANSERDAEVKALDAIANGGVDWKYDGMTDEPATVNAIERRMEPEIPGKQIRWAGKLVKVGDLRVGQVVDLEGDLYADPDKTNRHLAEHVQVVEEIVCNNERAVRVVFEDSESVVFPADHKLLCVGRLETESDRRG